MSDSEPPKSIEDGMTVVLAVLGGIALGVVAFCALVYVVALMYCRLSLAPSEDVARISHNVCFRDARRLFLVRPLRDPTAILAKLTNGDFASERRS